MGGVVIPVLAGIQESAPFRLADRANQPLRLGPHVSGEAEPVNSGGGWLKQRQGLMLNYWPRHLVISSKGFVKLAKKQATNRSP
jgi:hypothetical protein